MSNKFFLGLMILAFAIVGYFFLLNPPQPQEIEESELALYYPQSSFSLEQVNHTAFTLAYDESKEQARWVVYKLEGVNVDKPNLKRDGIKWLPDPKVSTGSALDEDYRNSGYSRGHLAPNDDFNHESILQQETFYLSNASPQLQTLNGGGWLALENYARKQARQKENLIVVTGPIFRNDNITYIGKTNQIEVPDKFFKILYHPASQTSEAFIMNNSKTKQTVEQSRTSLEEVEKVTGLKFAG